jgi:hypothetical protein
MGLPEFVTPVLSIAGPSALVFVVLRFGPDAVLRLMAGTVAIVTSDKDRGERCLEVLRVLRGRAAPERRPSVHRAVTGEPAEPPAAPGPQPLRTRSPRGVRDRGDSLTQTILFRVYVPSASAQLVAI